ncbi:mCG148257 [Mus musculus]|nr:mCG148257 [Mus musculus]
MQRPQPNSKWSSESLLEECWDGILEPDVSRTPPHEELQSKLTWPHRGTRPQ